MVFSSVPVYLDPPNWNQLQPSHPPVPAVGGVSGGVGVDAHQLQPPPAPPRPDGNVGGSAARPGSMADRARLARVPQPEPGLKCPRCESTNTKFCYFNNYSLSQPRHFCKTCRRYWTRGGALRNVPVGGGCRRNKRSKSSSGSSKSSANATAAADHHQVGTSASSATSGATAAALSSNNPQAPPHLPFMASLHPLSDYAAAANIRLNLGGMQPLDTVDFQVPSVGLEQWRLQQVQHQFPFMAGLEPAPVAPSSVGLFPFDGTEGGVTDGVLGSLSGHVHGKPSASGLITQLASVKMEENNPHELTLPKQYLGIPGNDQYWVGGGGSTGGGSSSGGRWMDLSGFNPSSTSNIL